MMLGTATGKPALAAPRCVVITVFLQEGPLVDLARLASFLLHIPTVGGGWGNGTTLSHLTMCADT